MDAIKVFQTLMDGEYIMHKISNSIISILIQLINNELLYGSIDAVKSNQQQYRCDDDGQSRIPKYVGDLFHHFCKDVMREVTIRMCYLSKRYISPSLRKYFIGNGDNMVKLDVLFNLFPSLQKLRVTYEQNQGIVLNHRSYEYFLNFLDAQSSKPYFQFDELLIRPNDRKSKRIDPMIERYSEL